MTLIVACSVARRRRTCSRGSCPPAQQALVARSPTLDLGGVGGVIGHQRAAGLLLIPAERGHVPVAPQQQAGLAGAGLRGQVALPADQSVRAVREPASDRRRVIRRAAPRAALPSPSPSISNRITPGTSVRSARRSAAYPSPDDAQVHGVAVDVEQRRDDHRHERQRERDRQVHPERRCLAVDPVEGERDGPGAQRERAEPKGDDRQRQCQAHHDRPQNRVDQRHRGGDEHGGRERQRCRWRTAAR